MRGRWLLLPDADGQARLILSAVKPRAAQRRGRLSSGAYPGGPTTE
jgi:hypothetical protein